MFAAAATVAMAIFHAALSVARWAATRLLLIALFLTAGPWLLRQFGSWLWDSFAGFRLSMASFFQEALESVTGQPIDISYNITGVAGYIADQIAFPQYCAIILSGWAAYFVLVALRPRV